MKDKIGRKEIIYYIREEKIMEAWRMEDGNKKRKAIKWRNIHSNRPK